jgi:hypothetical protein
MTEIVSSIALLFTSLNSAIKTIGFKDAKRDKKIEALTAIQKAVIATQDYYNKHGNKSNVDISNLWLEAFNKTKKAKIFDSEKFADSLYQKARFWSDTGKWLIKEASMELVPLLKDIDEECNAILEILN